MSFGNDVRTVMTVSLPQVPLATTVQLAYSLAVVFTFPLQNFPALEIVCVAIERLLSSGKVGGSSGIKRNMISSCLIVGLSIIALITMNDLDKVVSFMGSLLGIPLAFIMPPLIQNKLQKDLVKWRRNTNILIYVKCVECLDYKL